MLKATGQRRLLSSRRYIEVEREERMGLGTTLNGQCSRWRRRVPLILVQVRMV